MFKRNEKYYPWLVPYLEGDLDDARAGDLRARLADDPALAAEAERLRRTLDAVRETARRSPAAVNASPPVDLWPRLRDRLEPAPAPRRRAPVRWVAAGAAASVAFAALWLPGHLAHPPLQSAHVPASPASAAKKPQQMASASGPEASRVDVPAVPVVVPPKSAGPVVSAGGGSVVYATPPASAKPALPAPVLSGHDPFAAASAKPSEPKAALKEALRLPLPASPPPAGSVHASVSPLPAPTLHKGPTQMASRDVPRATDEGMAGTATYASPATDRLATPEAAPLAAKLVPPTAPSAPLPPPAPAASSVVSGGAAIQAADGALAQNGVGLLRDEAREKSSPSPPGMAFGGGALGSAAHKPNAFALAPRPGMGYFSAHSPRNVQHRGAQQQTAQSQNALPAFDLSVTQTLDTWQAALAQSEQPPLLGQDTGAMQANQALMAARESGNLDALRARLEARRAQSPRDLVTARMLAAVYDFGFSTESALRERRRLVTLDGATGEDWFALAEAEGHTGNGQAARAAYRRALDAPAPLSPFHAGLARTRG